MKKLVFFKCQTCGNVAIKLVDSGVPMFCCGKPMTELLPNSVEAAGEKHKPVVEQTGSKVLVKAGAIAHPMTPEHYISHIVLQTSEGFYIKQLSPNNLPQAEFALAEQEKMVAAYSYCNLHGLWEN